MAPIKGDLPGLTRILMILVKVLIESGHWRQARAGKASAEKADRVQAYD